MTNDDEKRKRIVSNEIDFNELTEYSTEDDVISSVVRDASLAGTAMQA